MAIIIKSTNNKFLEGMEKGELSCPVGGNANLYSTYGKEYGDSYKTKNKTTIWPSISTIGHKKP